MTDSLHQQPVNPMLPANEPERLAALYRYQVLDTPAEAAFDRITALAARLFKKPIALISLVDESRVWFKSSIGFGAPEVRRDDTICNFAVLTDKPLIIPDTRLDDRFTCNPFVQGAPGMRFYAGAPLLDRDGFNLGTLCLLDTVPHEALTAEEAATLVDLAAMVVSELELRLAARQSASVEAALVEITQGVSRVTGGAFFDELVRHFAKVLGADYVYIGLVEGTEPKMMRTIATCDRGNIVENLEYRLQDTPCWEAILQGRGSANEQRKLCCYPRNVQAQFPNAPLLKPLSVESYISIPFFGADGNVLGLLGVMDGKPLENVQLAESLLTIFASRIATELERQQSESILTAQTRLLEAVSTGQPLDDCLSALCRSISILSPHTRACVLLTDVRRRKFPRSITPDFPPSLSQGLKDVPINELAIGTCGTAVYCGEPVTCTDIASDESWSQSWRNLCLAHDIRACHSVPMMGIDNLPLGSVMLCFNEARSPTDWEYRLGEFGTKIASIAIERLRSSENLCESEERLNLALTAADMATWDADLSTGKTIWSAKHFEILGYDPDTDGVASVEMWLSRVHPDDRAAVMQTWETAQKEKSLYRSEYRFVRADTGAVVWVAATGQFLDNQAGEGMRFVGVMFDISERKQTEIALVESQQFVQNIAATLPGILYVYDLVEQSNIYVNPQSLELLGYTPAQLQEHGADIAARMVHPDDLTSLMAYLAGFDAVQIGEWRELESRARHANGEWRWLLTRSTVFNTTPAGDVRQILGVSIDISLRKRAEAAIHESKAQLEFLLAAAEFGDWDLNLSDGTAYRSLRHDRIFGYESLLPQWTYDMFLDHVLPEDRAQVDRKYQYAIANNEPWNFECQIRRVDNQVRWIWVSGYIYHNAQGEATRMLGLVADITDRKTTELALRDSEERFRTLADNMSQFAWMTDENGSIFWYNNRWFEYTGTTLAQMQGWGWQSVHHPEHVDRVVERIRHSFETGEYWEDTFPLRGRDGTYRWFLSRALPIRDESGRILRWFGTNTDITDRKLAEAALAERNQELNSFAYTVSHDLKAPLRAISNLSVWIEEDLEGKLPPDTEQQFDLLRTRVKRMESTIDSLLLYARAGRQEAQLETFDLAELLAEIIDSLAPPEGFRIDIQPPLPTLTTKRVFLSQVFANLVSNAIKHHNSVTGHLQISAIEHPDYHEFILKDDGPGIAPEHHDKVFAIFQTLKVKDNSDSTGIGLAIVKKIIETEHGTIRLESSLGEGTTFYVTWPKSHQ